MKARQYITPETLTFFWPEIHTSFYNTLKTNYFQKLMWRRPDGEAVLKAKHFPVGIKNSL